MEAYTGFASVYDAFMDNVPYEEWSRYLIALLQEYGVAEGIVAELGCGTGSITRRLARAGYDMIGIDNSADMLEMAMEKQDGKNNILYLCQDMREMELYGTVSAMVSICDSMNYITSEEDLLTVFRLVNNYLEAGGLFLFDLNTVYKYETLLADNTFAENREDASFIWDNYYDCKEQLNEYDLTVYVKAETEEEEEKDEDGELFWRFQEVHYQKAYTLECIQKLLKQAGMEFVAAYDAGTRKPPAADSERIYIVARECWQDGKTYV